MNIITVWIERDTAGIYLVEDDALKKVTSSGLSSTVEKNTSPYPSFYMDALPHLRENCSIFLFGPDVQKYKFQTFLQEHYPLIAKNIIHLETMDHFLESEILNVVDTHLPQGAKNAKVN